MAFSRLRALRALRGAGFAEAEVRPFDFLHPATPERFCDPLDRLGRRLERLPLVREFTGSFAVRGRRPGGPL